MLKYSFVEKNWYVCLYKKALTGVTNRVRAL